MTDFEEEEFEFEFDPPRAPRAPRAPRPPKAFAFTAGPGKKHFKTIMGGPGMHMMDCCSGDPRTIHIEMEEDGSMTTTSMHVFQEIDDGNVQILLKLPGIDKTTLQVRAKPTKLSVSADLKEEYVGKIGGQKVKRVIKLIDEVNPDAAQAKYADGVLKISMPLANPGQNINVE